MDIIDFIDFRIEDLTFELTDKIQNMGDVSHSPNELQFLAGRIFELNTQIERLKYYKREHEIKNMGGNYVEK